MRAAPAQSTRGPPCSLRKAFQGGKSSIWTGRAPHPFEDPTVGAGDSGGSGECPRRLATAREVGQLLRSCDHRRHGAAPAGDGRAQGSLSVCDRVLVSISSPASWCYCFPPRSRLEVSSGFLYHSLYEGSAGLADSLELCSVKWAFGSAIVTRLAATCPEVPEEEGVQRLANPFEGSAGHGSTARF